MRVLLSTYGSRGDVGPMVGLVVQLRALGAEAWVCAPPHAAELVATRFDTAAAAAEECECDAPAAASVMPTGGWR